MAVKCILTGQTPSVLDGVTENVQTQIDDKQSRITANGFLKGDGTGDITADKPVFYVTITGTVVSPTADKTPAEIYQAYEDGYAVYANIMLTGSSSSTNLKGLLPLTYITGTAAQCAITFSSISGKEIKEVRYSPAITKWEVPYSGVITTKDDLPSTPSDIGAQPKITAKGLLKGNGNGVVTAADETEVELVDLPQEIVWVKYTKTDSKYTVTNAQEILEAYKQGNKIIALRLEITEHGMYNTCIMYLNTVKSAYIVSNRNYYFEFFAFELENDVNTDSNSMYPYYNARLFIQEADGTLNDSLTNLSVYNKAQLPGPMYTKSISLPAASWTGADPYTQEVNISSIATAKTRVDIQPSEIIYDQLVADSVGYLAIKNDNGTFTAIAKGGKPSIDLALQITYTNNYYYM